MESEPEALRVYYDSFFLMEVALDGRLAELGKGIFARIKDGPHAVVVSQVVVGETHSVLMGRYRGQSELVGVIARLQEVILSTGVDTNMDAKVDGRGGLKPLVPEKVLEAMAGLLENVPNLDGTDLVILAVVLADPYSAMFITKDRILLRNKKIFRYERKLRKAGKRKVRLEITSMMLPARRAPACPRRRTRTPLYT